MPQPVYRPRRISCQFAPVISWRSNTNTETEKRRMSQAMTVACGSVGGQAALARAIGRSEETASDWANGKSLVEPELVVQIERITGVSRYELRPDLNHGTRHAVPAHQNRERLRAPIDGESFLSGEVRSGAPAAALRIALGRHRGSPGPVCVWRIARRLCTGRMGSANGMDCIDLLGRPRPR